MQVATSVLLVAVRRKVLAVLTACSLSLFVIHVYNTTDRVEIELPSTVEQQVSYT